MAKTQEHKKKNQEETLDTPSSGAETFKPSRWRSSLAKRMSVEVALPKVLEEDPKRTDEGHADQPAPENDVEKSFKKFYGRYQDLIEKYQRSVNVMMNDSFPG